MKMDTVASYLSKVGFIHKRSIYDRRGKSELSILDLETANNIDKVNGKVIIDIAPRESEVIFFQAQLILDSSSIVIRSNYKNVSFRGKTKPSFMGNGEYQESLESPKLETIDSFNLIKRGAKKYLVHFIDGLPADIIKVPILYGLETGILPEFSSFPIEGSIKEIDSDNIAEVYKLSKK